MRVWSLDQEDPPEEGRATHSSILAWTAWTEEPGRLQSIGSHRVRQDWSDLAYISQNAFRTRACTWIKHVFQGRAAIESRPVVWEQRRNWPALACKVLEVLGQEEVACRVRVCRACCYFHMFPSPGDQGHACLTLPFRSTASVVERRRFQREQRRLEGGRRGPPLFLQSLLSRVEYVDGFII